MSSKFRTFMMALILIPCMFVFAGCNAQLDQKVSLDTRGNYSNTSTPANAKAAVEDSNINEVNISTSSLRMSMDFAITMQSIVTEGSMTYIIKATKSSETKTKYESAARIRANAQTGEINESALISCYNIRDIDSDNSDNNSIKSYIDYNVTDPADPTKKLTGKYDISTNHDIADVTDTFDDLMDVTMDTINNYLPNSDGWTAVWSNNKAQYAIATSGNTTKVRITTPAVKDSDDKVIVPEANVYYIITDGKFVGIQVEKITLTFGPISITCSFGLTTFDGNIDMPNFNDYAENPAQS
ncbi:MAG: hypothetical protein IKC79_01850 [Clostridia bacterium]|nr:hypothetical protein [Clostridia bacterium]